MSWFRVSHWRRPHVPGFEGRKDGHVEGLHETAGNPSVEVVDQVKDADGDPVDAIQTVVLPVPVLRRRAQADQVSSLRRSENTAYAWKPSPYLAAQFKR